jgi:phosphate transport system substrate-binding protein
LLLAWPFRSKPDQKGPGVRKALVATAFAFLFFTANENQARAETLRAGGTGAANELLVRIGAALAAQGSGTKLEVIRGLGSSGGISAVADGAIDFAVSGRPLSAAEKAKSLVAEVMFRSPFGLATSHWKPGSISKSELSSFVGNPSSTWPDRTPVKVILRPSSDSDTQIVVDAFPGMETALARLRARPDVPVAATDQDNADLAEKMEGSLTVMNLTQMITEKRILLFVGIDGALPSIAGAVDGSYPYIKNFYIVYPESKRLVLESVRVFLRSPAGVTLLKEAGALPAAAGNSR